MARKLFISFLGTNFYHECYYTDGGWESNKTRYVQQATLERLVALNEAPDAVRIFIHRQLEQGQRQTREQIYKANRTVCASGKNLR